MNLIAIRFLLNQYLPANHLYSFRKWFVRKDLLEIPSEGEFEYLLELLYFDCAVGQIDVVLPIKILVIPDIKKIPEEYAHLCQQVD